MNIKHLLLFAITLLYFTNAHSMESYFAKTVSQGSPTSKDRIQNVIHTNNHISLPTDIWPCLIAPCETKDILRATCKYFHQFIKNNKEAILTHPSLVISQEALDKFAFYYAALGNTAMVQILLNKGANPNTYHKDNGMALICYAIRYAHTGMLDVLLKHSVHLPSKDQIQMKTTGLCYASEKGLFNAVQKLLTGTYNINARNHQGKTPLYIATEQRNIGIMKLLLSNNANPNKGYNYIRPVNDSHCLTHYSPLHTAIEHRYKIAVQLLIEYGAEICSEDICLARDKSHTQIFKLLLDKINCPVNTYSYNNSVINELIETHNAKLRQNKANEEGNNNCIVQ